MTVLVYLFLNYVIANLPTLQYCVILFIFYISIGEIICIAYPVLDIVYYFLGNIFIVAVHAIHERCSSTDYLSCVPLRVLLSDYLQTISALILII